MVIDSRELQMSMWLREQGTEGILGGIAASVMGLADGNIG